MDEARKTKEICREESAKGNVRDSIEPTSARLQNAVWEARRPCSCCSGQQSDHSNRDRSRTGKNQSNNVDESQQNGSNRFSNSYLPSLNIENSSPKTKNNQDPPMENKGNFSERQFLQNDSNTFGNPFENPFGYHQGPGKTKQWFPNGFQSDKQRNCENKDNKGENSNPGQSGPDLKERGPKSKWYDSEAEADANPQNGSESEDDRNSELESRQIDACVASWESTSFNSGDYDDDSSNAKSESTEICLEPTKRNSAPMENDSKPVVGDSNQNDSDPSKPMKHSDPRGRNEQIERNSKPTESSSDSQNYNLPPLESERREDIKSNEQSPNYRPSEALDLFKKHAAPDEKPLLKEWLKQGLATAVHESIHLLSKDELGGYLTPDLTRHTRIDADKEFGRDNYLPTPKSSISIPSIQGMTDTYLTGREAASSARDFGFWLDELNAYNSETLLHKEKGGQGVDVNFTGVTMFGAGYMQYLNKLNPEQSGKLFNEHGDTLRKLWSTTEDALAYGKSQGFPVERADYFNKFFNDQGNRRTMERLMGRKLRIPDRLG